MSAMPLLRPAALVAATLATCLLASAARAEALVEGPQPQTPRVEQKIERIHVQDEGTTIDEIRYGGQTQSITVQPRGVKEYDVAPLDGPRRRASERDGVDASSGGARTWKMLGF